MAYLWHIDKIILRHERNQPRDDISAKGLSNHVLSQGRALDGDLTLASQVDSVSIHQFN